ncbi:chromosome segregation protein sudA [Rhizoctonia solani]|uniref:Structural maintenance of chromosomes protein n=1 Tax=Rhizoctonia solani TaxID=456999 RepID=A0A8H7H8G8_9AGAM|nr:chromosome segregation protein sudA [Rhizoctonia solani]KAF8678916.1 Structural maintenance of [Rhizoctonia solani]QRW25433.1 chromosome segregation protein sudA [Rhizoctonia solani]
MYIKTLTIQGFKSYRDQTAIEPFSPAHNVVVGRNGSGKSNFFAAIRFVLSDAYTSMSKQERQSLLHEGVSTAQTMSAYVEIVFDNSDNRFPTGKDTVILRRTIGLKKDEYSLDRKSASKGDVMNLLESAGFSRSNPYYIVPQGRITSLTNAKDHERLALLKEVAGTKVYEQRRVESLKIMEETDAKRSKIAELLSYIATRLEELEGEKDELKEFHNADRERRCLEYALYTRELEEVANNLEQLEEERKQEIHAANTARTSFTQREEQLAAFERQISSHRQTLAILGSTRPALRVDLADLTATRAKAQLAIQDLQERGEMGEQRREEMQTELETIEARAAEVEAGLAEIRPEWEEVVEQEKEEKRLMDNAQTRLGALHAKQGRISRFSSRAERDNYLRGEIKGLKTAESAVVQSLNAAEEEIASLKEKTEDIHRRTAESREQVQEKGNSLTQLGEEIVQKNAKKAKLVEQRKELWREDTKYEQLVGSAKDELHAAQRALAGMMDRDTGSGLRAVDRITEQLGLEGVYGPLYRLFEIPDKKYSTAIEQTAGNSLFHVVVDTDATAQKVLEVLQREKSGRVTFMPLNRLKPKLVPFPQAPDAIPLIDRLQFDPLHRRAFEQVFGKTAVCENLQVAAAYVRSHGLNTITLEGDKVDRKGALTGGYHDVRRSRIETIRAVKHWTQKYEADSKILAEIKAQDAQLEQEITKLTGEIQVLTSKRTQAQAMRAGLADEAYALDVEQTRLAARIEQLERAKAEQEADIQDMRLRRETYDAEMKTPLAAGLSQQEIDEMEELGREADARKKTLLEVGKRKTELGMRKNMLEIELRESLKRKKDELRTKIDSLAHVDTDDLESTGADLAAKTQELDALNDSITTLQDRITGTLFTEFEHDKLTSELNKLMAQVEKLQTQQVEDSRGISRQQKSTERYLTKRQVLLTRKDECNTKIRDLGVLPEEAYEKYVNERIDKLVKRLHNAKENLKKFAHVNKKAFEQYTNFTKQREQFIKRREDLDESANSITELIESLDRQKDEAIERTFKQVSKNFEEVFEKLVPAGRGRLIMQKRLDMDQDDDDDDDAGQQSSIDNYTGVSIKVSFNSKVDEGLRIQQLSGGQKSLVALATVFAIQKCDPAPFYLFDEIDANLDAQYRTAVASMIHELSSNAQFITTTFRPEMLVRADKFYGVLFNNQKISSIRSITREEAQEFVEQETAAQ